MEYLQPSNKGSKFTCQTAKVQIVQMNHKIPPKSLQTTRKRKRGMPKVTWWGELSKGQAPGPVSCFVVLSKELVLFSKSNLSTITKIGSKKMKHKQKFDLWPECIFLHCIDGILQSIFMCWKETKCPKVDIDDHTYSLWGHCKRGVFDL
jgi:hypothetical protein